MPLRSLSVFLPNLGAESPMLVELHQDGTQDRRLGVVVAFELPRVDVDDGCPFALLGFQAALVPRFRREAVLKHLHDAGLAAAPIAEHAYGDGQHLGIEDHR